MKRMWKLMLVDVAIVIANIVYFTNFNYSFSPVKFGSFLITIFVLLASVVIHCIAYSNMPEDVTDSAEQINNLSGDASEQFATYRTELRSLKKENPDFASVINLFMKQIDSFSTKREALEDLIRLNDDKAKAFLTDRNNDVHRFLVKNLKKFVKRLIAYNAKSKQNRSSSIEEENGVREIISQNNELINLYDQLLDEVARMGDDFDIQDPGLQSVIENLQSLRSSEEDESDEAEEEEIKLFVASSGGKH